MSVSVNTTGEELDPQKEQQKLEAEMLDYAYRRAQELAPVDTGQLKAGIEKTDTGLKNDVEYAAIVHDGTIDRMPVPFLRDAMVEARARALAGRL